jgi:hypothetical protein
MVHRTRRSRRGVIKSFKIIGEDCMDERHRDRIHFIASLFVLVRKDIAESRLVDVNDLLETANKYCDDEVFFGRGKSLKK